MMTNALTRRREPFPFCLLSLIGPIQTISPSVTPSRDEDILKQVTRLSRFIRRRVANEFPVLMQGA